MKLSIALATYNGAKYLQAQLESFVAQTRQPDELVVTDDCSTDNTLQILENFANVAPFRVVIHSNEYNYGYCGNFNQALLRTTGDLVFLSDQDDVWFSEKIELIATVMEEDMSAWVVMNDAALTDGNLNDTGLTKLGQICSAGLKESRFVMGCCAAVRRDLLDLCLPIPEKYPAHDYWLVRIADGMGRKRIVSEVLQYYRRHGSNESQWVVNRTSRQTALGLKIEGWQKRLRSCFVGTPTFTKTSDVFGIDKDRLLLAWAKNALVHAPVDLAGTLKIFIREIEVDCAKQEDMELGRLRRIEVQKKPFPQRVSGALRFWNQGGYDEFSGILSALRDIILGH